MAMTGILALSACSPPFETAVQSEKVEEPLERKGIHYSKYTLPKDAQSDLAESLESIGDRLTLVVEEGALYRIRVKTMPGYEFTSPKIIHDQIIQAKTDQMEIGLFCCLDYSVADDDSIHAEKKRDQLVLEVENEVFRKNVEPWGYRPLGISSSSIRITSIEEVFFVMWHPNNMDATDFKMAVRHAMNGTDEAVVATIQKIQGSGKPPQR